MKKFARWGHRASNSARNSLQITWRPAYLAPLHAAFPHSSKTRAERAFHLGGAGAPAHASCGTKPIFNFFKAPLS